MRKNERLYLLAIGLMLILIATLITILALKDDVQDYSKCMVKIWPQYDGEVDYVSEAHCGSYLAFDGFLIRYRDKFFIVTDGCVNGEKKMTDGKMRKPTSFRIIRGENDKGWLMLQDCMVDSNADLALFPLEDKIDGLSVINITKLSGLMVSDIKDGQDLYKYDLFGYIQTHGGVCAWMPRDFDNPSAGEVPVVKLSVETIGAPMFTDNDVFAGMIIAENVQGFGDDSTGILMLPSAEVIKLIKRMLK